MKLEIKLDKATVKDIGNKMKKDVTKKQCGKQKTFQDEGHYQGNKKVPLPQTKEYGTGLPYKKPSAPMAKKKAVGKGK